MRASVWPTFVHFLSALRNNSANSSFRPCSAATALLSLFCYPLRLHHALCATLDLFLSHPRFGSRTVRCRFQLTWLAPLLVVLWTVLKRAGACNSLLYLQHSAAPSFSTLIFSERTNTLDARNVERGEACGTSTDSRGARASGGLSLRGFSPRRAGARDLSARALARSVRVRACSRLRDGSGRHRFHFELCSGADRVLDRRRSRETGARRPSGGGGDMPRARPRRAAGPSLSVSPWQKRRRSATAAAGSRVEENACAGSGSSGVDPVVVVEFDPRSGAIFGEGETEAKAPPLRPFAADGGAVVAEPPRLVTRRYAGACVLAVLSSGGVVGHLLHEGGREGGSGGDPAVSFRLSVPPPPPSETLDCSYTDDSYPASCRLHAFGRRGELAFRALAGGGDAPRLETDMSAEREGSVRRTRREEEQAADRDAVPWIGERLASIRVVTSTILVRRSRTKRGGRPCSERRFGFVTSIAL